MELVLLAMSLGLVDGVFNPCALSVLFFLVAYLLSIGSSKKCLKMGLVYSSVVFLVYFLFMFGTLNIVSIIGFLEVVKKVTASILLIAGIISLKDFFFYGKWISLEIPKFAKPEIEKQIKMATLPSVALLGGVVSLVEIPCTGGFPLAFITILAERVSGILAVLYLLLYNFFFVLPLILLILIFYFGLQKVEKVENLRLKTRKYMRLITGSILIALGIAMFLRVI